MGILDDLERGIERAVNSVFARTFRSGLQPVEIVAALKREIDSKASIVSRDRTLAPNEYTITLSESDYERVDSLGEALSSEIRTELNTYAKHQSYRLVGPLTLTFRSSPNLREGLIQVSSVSTGRDVVWTPVLIINGRKHHLPYGTTIIGRGSEADITISDAGASRKHLEIVRKESKLTARDLGSTNGTKLNGVKFNSTALGEDSVLQIGRTTLTVSYEPERQRHEHHYREESTS